MGKTLRIGTRKSPLALKQVDEIISGLREFCGGLAISITAIDTFGDRDKVTPISDIEGTDFFTKDVDELVLNGKADAAVHSAKDLADTLPDNLTVACITKPIDAHDCLVSRAGISLNDLPFGAKIGTSSFRRKSQLKKYRNDFELIDIRGDIEERLGLLDGNASAMDAIVIAAAGLIRLGLEKRITQKIPLDILTPHPLQGSLAVVTKKDRFDLIDLFRQWNGERHDA